MEFVKFENLSEEELKSLCKFYGRNIITRENFYSELFLKAISNNCNAIKDILMELAKTKEGENIIKCVVRDVRDYGYDKRLVVYNHVMPFCKENNIDITKKHLKTL